MVPEFSSKMSTSTTGVNCSLFDKDTAQRDDKPPDDSTDPSQFRPNEKRFRELFRLIPQMKQQLIDLILSSTSAAIPLSEEAFYCENEHEIADSEEAFNDETENVSDCSKEALNDDTDDEIVDSKTLLKDAHKKGADDRWRSCLCDMFVLVQDTVCLPTRIGNDHN